MIPITGFAPDMDPATPGLLTDCDQVIPFDAGVRGAPSALDASLSALAAECRGAALLTDLAGTRRLFAGTSTQLYEQTGTGWTIRSASTYALGADQRWAFAQIGNSALAATPSKKIQRSTSGAFAEVTTAPQAQIVVVASGFAMALNTDATADTWKCSAYLDETDWTLSVSTQCVSGRLVSAPGALTAGCRFGDDVVAFKDRAVYYGRYVGAPDVWRWELVSNEVGCVGQEAVAATPLGLVFVGLDGVYLFDGTAQVKSLTDGVLSRWFRAAVSATYRFRSKVLWDKSSGCAWVWYPSSASTGSTDKCIVFHVPTKRWGVANSTVEAVLNYTSAAITYDSGDLGTYDGGASIPYDSPIWNSGEVLPAVFNTSHKLCTLTGSTASSWFTTGDHGEDRGYTFCDTLTVRYALQPTTSTATGYTRDELGGTVATGTAIAKADGKHDLRQTGRWHRYMVAQTGDWRASGYQPKLVLTGTR